MDLPAAAVAVVGVRVAAAGLREAAAQHVADREDGRVQPHLVCLEAVVVAVARRGEHACEQDAREDDEIRVELGRLERGLRLGGEAPERASAAAVGCSRPCYVGGCHEQSPCTRGKWSEVRSWPVVQPDRPSQGYVRGIAAASFGARHCPIRSYPARTVLTTRRVESGEEAAVLLARCGREL